MQIHRGDLAAAILQAIADHGYPNSFSCGELHRLYGAPRPTISGKLGSDTWHMSQLQKETHLGRQLSYNSVRKCFCV